MSNYIDVIGHFNNEYGCNAIWCPLFHPDCLLHLSHTVTMYHCSLMFTIVLFLRFAMCIQGCLTKHCCICWMRLVYSCGKYLSHLLPNFTYFKYQICYSTHVAYMNLFSARKKVKTWNSNIICKYSWLLLKHVLRREVIPVENF